MRVLVLDPIGLALDWCRRCLADGHEVKWFIKQTVRMGWPTFNIQQALHEGDSAEWLLDLASGKDAGNWQMDTPCVGVVMSIPDYPYSHLTRKEVIGVPLWGLTPSVAHNVHPCEMMLGEAPHQANGKIVTAPCLVTAGDYVLVASGTGNSIRQARQRAYRVLNRLHMPNSPMWRTDIGLRLKHQLPDCQRHGYAMGLEY